MIQPHEEAKAATTMPGSGGEPVKGRKPVVPPHCKAEACVPLAFHADTRPFWRVWPDKTSRKSSAPPVPAFFLDGRIYTQ